MSHPCIQPSKNNIPGGGTLCVSPTCPTDKRMMSHATMIVILTPAINKFPTIWWEMRSQLLEEIKHLTNAAATPELLHTNHQPAISHQLLTAHQHNTWDDDHQILPWLGNSLDDDKVLMPLFKTDGRCTYLGLCISVWTASCHRDRIVLLSLPWCLVKSWYHLRAPHNCFFSKNIM